MIVMVAQKNDSSGRVAVEMDPSITHPRNYDVYLYGYTGLKVCLHIR